MKNVGLFLVFLVTTIHAAGSLAGPPAQYWEYWDASDEQNRASIDHSAWDSILERFVVAGDDSGISSFRYGEMNKAARNELDGYIDDMTDVDPRDYASLEQKAYWMNLYNALSVQAVLENFEVLRSSGFSPLLKEEAWGKQRIKVAGERLSLNDIEHRILRPIWKDHRILFGLNCATMDCPNFTLDAFTAGNIKEQLVASGNRFINLNSGVVYQDGVLSASRIFKDYMGDFAESEKNLKKVFAHYSRDMKALYMLGYRGEINYISDNRLNMPATASVVP